jgi:hypothetical protein
VRHGLGVGFPGGTYDQLFYVADAEAEGAWSDRDITGYLEERTFCLAFPVRSPGTFRFIGLVPEALRGRDDFRSRGWPSAAPGCCWREWPCPWCRTR